MNIKTYIVLERITIILGIIALLSGIWTFVVGAYFWGTLVVIAAIWSITLGYIYLKQFKQELKETTSQTTESDSKTDTSVENLDDVLNYYNMDLEPFPADINDIPEKDITDIEKAIAFTDEIIPRNKIESSELDSLDENIQLTTEIEDIDRNVEIIQELAKNESKHLAQNSNVSDEKEGFKRKPMEVKSQNNLNFENLEDLINSLQGLIQIVSTNGDAGETTEEAPLGVNINEAINYVLDLGKEFGFRTKNLDGYSGWVEIGPEDSEELLGIMTHVDTVPVGEGWEHEPFDLTIEDGKMYGRGTNDDKGPVIATLYAMKAINDSDIDLNKRVRLIVGGDEESGTWQCLERYKETEQIPDISFSPDACYPVIFAEKGILQVKFKKDEVEDVDLTLDSGTVANIVPEKAEATFNNKNYKVEGVAAHAMEPEKGDNALLKLGKFLKEEGAQHSFLDLLEIANTDGLNIALSDDVSGDLTFNPAIGHIGDDGSYLISDIRYPVTLDKDDIIERMSEAISPLGYEVEIVGHNEPLYVEKDSELVKTLVDVYKQATGLDDEPIALGGGTYARAFDNAVAFGVLFPGEPDMCHQRDEYWPVEDLESNMHILADAILALAQ